MRSGYGTYVLSCLAQNATRAAELRGYMRDRRVAISVNVGRIAGSCSRHSSISCAKRRGQSSGISGRKPLCATANKI